MSASGESLTVFDVGARFGIHPSWSAIKGSPLLTIHAFEPDAEEARRLESKYAGNPRYRVYPVALGEANTTKTLNILSHKGQSSFLDPNPDGAWFAVTQPDDGRVEQSVSVPMVTMDDWCRENGIVPDFLKIDSEGYDYFVLQGGAETIAAHVLGIRCEAYFNDDYLDVPKFDKVFPLLREMGFVLANMDYDGRGSAQSYFCPNSRYGILTAAEAVFIRTDDFIQALPTAPFLKCVVFMFLNNLEDLAMRHILKRPDALAGGGVSLAAMVERMFLLASKKFMTLPGTGFDQAKRDFERVFGKPYPDKHRFFEDDLLNPA